MFTTNSQEILHKYRHHSNNQLAIVLKLNGIGTPSSSRNTMLNDIIYIKMQQSKQTNPITPERVVKWEITKRYKCYCDDGKHKGTEHMGIAVKLILDDGKTKLVDLCQNSGGINVCRPIEGKLYNSSSTGKKKNYIKNSIFYPIQHWIAQELDLMDMWETY